MSEVNDTELELFLREHGLSEESISMTLSNPQRRKLWEGQYLQFKFFSEPVKPLDPTTQAAYDRRTAELKEQIEASKSRLDELERYMNSGRGRK